MIAFHAIDYSQTGQLCKYVIIWDWKSCPNRAFQWSLGNASNSSEGYFGGCSFYDHILQSYSSFFLLSQKKCLVLTTAGKILKYFIILNFGYITQKLSKKETKFKIEICNGDTHNLGGLNHANIQDVSIAYLSCFTIKEEHKW